MCQSCRTLIKRSFTVLTFIATLFVFLATPVQVASRERPQAYIVQASSADEARRLVFEAGGEVTAMLEVVRAVEAVLPPGAARHLDRTPGVFLFANARMNAAEAIPLVQSQ